ncbi:hypothetical protein [Clostridium sp. Marseille-Q2269]|nr:hypothetical protein [Clostridium sp. Marseille-Q2269]
MYLRISYIDWMQVSPQEVQRLSEKIFATAGVLGVATKGYYKHFNQYI